MFGSSNVILRNKRLSSYQLARLHTFEATGRHLSFALAAEELSLTPSAISHRINTLEKELGIKLFNRFHRRIELTEEGERIYWALKKTLEDINQEVLDIYNQEISGVLTVYSRPSIAQCWLVPRISDFTQRYPSIELNLLTGNDDINFRGYGIDLAIYFDDKHLKNLYCEDLISESIIPVCSPEYAARHELVGNIHHLANCTLLHDRQAWSNNSDFDEWRAWSEYMGLGLFPNKSNICFDRSDLAVIAAVNHSGVAMGRKRLIQKQLANNELIIPFDNCEFFCAQRYYLVTRDEKSNAKVQLFIQWLKKQILQGM